MMAARRKARSDPAQQAGLGSDDPVLSALRQAEAHYRESRLVLQRQLEETQRELARAREEKASLSQELAADRRQLDAERRRAQRQHDTASTLATALKDFYRAASSASVYDLVLRTCLTLTGATRGVYVTVAGQGALLRARAAVDVDDYPAAQPSSFISSLCRAALSNGGVAMCSDLSAWPERPADGEAFRTCVASSVVLRNDLSGVVIVADKAGGEFDEDDTDVLLSVGSQATVVLENTRLQREVQEAYLSIVTVLAESIAARSSQAPQYLESGARRASMVAERLGLSEHERSIVFYAALLHDVGNIGVSDGLLNKPGPLIDAERELIRAHTQIGYELLREVPLLDVVAGIVRNHHEWFDGSGYPNGLQGDAIPIAARIVAVVDAYGAMLAPRSYRPALSSELACEELRRGAGSQFDPQVVDAFLAVVNSVDARTQVTFDEFTELDLPGIDPRSAANLVAPRDAA
jgi:HD-GYP domain-containing protein (c-di-GMP phosphodiesterase class II)